MIWYDLKPSDYQYVYQSVLNDTLSLKRCISTIMYYNEHGLYEQGFGGAHVLAPGLIPHPSLSLHPIFEICDCEAILSHCPIM